MVELPAILTPRALCQAGQSKGMLGMWYAPEVFKSLQ